MIQVEELTVGHEVDLRTNVVISFSDRRRDLSTYFGPQPEMFNLGISYQYQYQPTH